MSPEHREAARHEARAVQQVAQQQAFEAGHEALSERERPVVVRDERLVVTRSASGPGRCAQVLPQGHERQEAHNAHEDRAASTTRVVTKPSAKPSFCRLTTGNSATAVPMPASATMISRKAPRTRWVPAAGAQDPGRIFRTGCRGQLGMEDEE